MNSDSRKKTISELMRDNDLFQKAMGEAVQDALRLHKRLGHPIVTWRDGKVAVIPPEEIEVEDNGGPLKLPYYMIP
jgi:hypothetical protein